MAERKFVRASDLFQCETCYHTSPKGCALGTFACDHGESYRPSMALLPTLTLDDLRPKGRWERDENRNVCCGVCKKKALEAKRGVWYVPNFCPNCGADMRGGDTR